MRRIGPAASEKKSFENVDDGRTDGRRIPLYTKSSPMSLRLSRARNEILSYTTYPVAAIFIGFATFAVIFEAVLLFKYLF